MEDTPAFVPAAWLLFCALIPYFVLLSQELVEQVRAGELEVWDVSGELSGLALRKPAVERNTCIGGRVLCGALSRRGAWTEQGDEQIV